MDWRTPTLYACIVIVTAWVTLTAAGLLAGGIAGGIA